MNLQTRTATEELTLAWARWQLKVDSQLMEADPLAVWCERSQHMLANITPDDWIAFRVLTGDRAPWLAAASHGCDSRLVFQWQQIHNFEESFFSLTSEEKRRVYGLLREQLQGNGAALVRLGRYERFLDIDFEACEELDDAAQLARMLMVLELKSPSYRHHFTERLIDQLAREPIRWRNAALAVIKHPQYAQIAPVLTEHLATAWSQFDRDRQLRRKRRRDFKCRYGSQMRQQAWRRLLPKLMRVALILLCLMGILAVILLLESRARPTELRLLPQSIAVSLEELQREAVRRIRVERSASTEKTAFADDPNTLAAWRTVAQSEGLQGLDRLELELKLRTKLVDQQFDGRIADSYREYGIAFTTWRKEVGEEIARKSTGVRQ